MPVDVKGAMRAAMLLSKVLAPRGVDLPEAVTYELVRTIMHFAQDAHGQVSEAAVAQLVTTVVAALEHRDRNGLD